MRLFRIFRIYLSLIPRTRALLAGQGLLPAQSVPLGTGAQQGKCLIILTYLEICIIEADTRLKAWFILTYKSVLKLWLLLSQITPEIFKICDYISSGLFTVGNLYYPHLPSSPSALWPEANTFENWSAVLFLSLQFCFCCRLDEIAPSLLEVHMSTSWICDFVVLPIVGSTSTELWKLSTRYAKVIQSFL